MNMNIRGFGNSRYSSFKMEPLTDDQLRERAPSIFATEPHESRSERFTHIPTQAVIAGLRAEGFEPYSAKQGNSRIPGKAEFTKHMIRFRHKDFDRTELEVGSDIHEIALVNSHDGTSAYQLMSCLMRTICLNGMIVSKGYEGVKVRHTGDAVNQVIEGAYTVLKQGPEVLRQIGDWRGVALSREEQMFFAEGAHALRFEGAKHSPKPEDLLKIRRNADKGVDLYTTMNVVQENVTKGGMRFLRPRVDEYGRTLPSVRARTKEVKSIDGDTRLNRELWALAEKMRELKAA